ncbi:MAG: amino acid ABC transporter substrate-binding protein [Burkholderiaceae bacterium]|nr:amino acid ABC transporter substrate-binding protein [Burkholderiaceae bacterium]
MKKLTATLWVSLGFLLAGCGPQDSAPHTQSSAPAAIQKIVVGMDENFPPMGFRNEKSELAGFDVDMAREAGKRMGIPIEFKPIDWIAKEAALSGKRVDVLWGGLAVTDERKKSMVFTAPYLQNHQIVLVAAGTHIHHRTDLAGKVVGAQDGSSAAQALLQEPALLASFQTFRIFSDSQTALEQLSQGRLQAVVLDEIVGRHQALLNSTEYTVLEDTLGSEDYAVGMRPEDTNLQTRLNKVLTDMHKDGTTERMALRWFGKDMTP